MFLLNKKGEGAKLVLKVSLLDSGVYVCEAQIRWIK